MATTARRPSSVNSLALAFCLMIAITVMALGLQKARSARAAWPREADAYYLPSASLLRLISLGHAELAADVVAARTYVYFGEQMLEKGAHQYLDRYLRTALTLDPYYRRLYHYGATMLVYNGHEITADMVVAANAILRRGIRHFPDDWELQHQLGFNEVFELPRLVPTTDPRVQGWRRSGAEALRRATLSPAAPGWLANAVANMLTEQGQEELAIRHLEQVYATTPDTYSREQVWAKLVKLRGMGHGRQVEDQEREFQINLGSGFPFAPEPFTLIAGPRINPLHGLPQLVR